MKLLLIHLIALTSLCLCVQTVCAQTPKDSSAVIKGHITHNTDSVLQYGHVGFLDTKLLSTPIDKDGNFETRIKIETNPQPVFFETGDGCQLYLIANDTVRMDWDTQDTSNTIIVKSPNPIREIELSEQVAEERIYMPKLRSTLQSLYENKPADSVKAARLNQLYNEEVKAVLAGSSQTHTEPWLIDIYFRYAEEMRSLNLFPAYNLTITDTASGLKNVPFFMLSEYAHGRLYQMESEDAFYHSSAYRDFIYNYIRFYDPFRATTTLNSIPAKGQPKELPFTPVWKEYYAGLRSFGLKAIRDWFITKCIIDGFKYYNYDEVSAVYKDFLTKDPTPSYVAVLKDNYNKVVKLRPGAPAPDFTLKDEHGQKLSLASFKGKVVYLDFWGVYCGPCMDEINNYTAQLHEKYKDKKVVFLNICVDAGETQWKNTLAKSHLDGVNLLTQMSGPVFSAYNIEGIPHYYIIDQMGKIVDNNAPRPSQGKLLTDALDKLIK